MRNAETDRSIIREVCSKGVTGEPRDTEIGHAWFGGGPLEKCLSRQLAGGLSYCTSGGNGGSVLVTGPFYPIFLQSTFAHKHYS